MTLKTVLYLHSNKEYAFEAALNAGCTEKQAEQFVYMAYEVRLNIELDPETGIAKATRVNGVELKEAVEI